MLLGNYAVILKNPSRSSGGRAYSGTIAPWDMMGAFYTGDGESVKYSAFPTATQDTYSFILPPKTGGEMSSTTSISGTSGLSASLTMGGAISASLSGAGAFSSSLGLLATLSATLAGISTLSAGISASLGLASTMGGTSSLSANVGMLVPFSANLSGTGALSANLKGMASLSATIYVNQSQSTVQQLVDGVWNAQTTDYVEVGSMGEAVQTSGGGGGATAAQIWAYSSRTLTESAGLTAEQAVQLSDVHSNVDIKSSQIQSGGGGFSVNYQVINSHTTNKVNELKEEIDKKIKEIPKVSLENIENTLNENYSQIELAKGEIIDTIKSESIDVCGDIVRKTKELKEDNVKTRNLVRQKSEKIDKNVSKLADRQDLTDKIIEEQADEIEDELEGIYNMECDMIENEIYNKEVDEIETELNYNQKTDGNDIDNSEG